MLPGLNKVGMGLNRGGIVTFGYSLCSLPYLIPMTSSSQDAYQALRDYLNGLLNPALADQALADVPAALRPGLEAFMTGKTEYQDEAGRRMIYAADLAAWAADLIYGAGLTAPLPLATVDVAALRAATLRHAA